jgi:adenosylmethionine-8-amino-7-oxononanoate aminotransferase
MPHYFVSEPQTPFGSDCPESELQEMQGTLASHHENIAAVILEPIVQGTGRMFFYSADYLRQVRSLCDRYGVLLIADEIATGFGRTGKMFACEHAGITPDIMCLGKTLTGGYMTLAATLCTREISSTISQQGGVFMHGPTYMGNPLACAVAVASIQLLCSSAWQARISAIETQLLAELAPCKTSKLVADVRVFGAIGVVELLEPVNMEVTKGFHLRDGDFIRNNLPHRINNER